MKKPALPSSQTENSNSGNNFDKMVYTSAFAKGWPIQLLRPAPNGMNAKDASLLGFTHLEGLNSSGSSKYFLLRWMAKVPVVTSVPFGGNICQW